MKTHTVIDGNAFYEVDDECMERQRLVKKDKTGDAEIQAYRWDKYRFCREDRRGNCNKSR